MGTWSGPYWTITVNRREGQYDESEQMRQRMHCDWGPYRSCGAVQRCRGPPVLAKEFSWPPLTGHRAPKIEAVVEHVEGDASETRAFMLELVE